MGNWDSYRDDLDALKTKLDNLIQTRNGVMKKIAEEEEEELMKPTNEVKLWLSRVQAVETEVDELIRGSSEQLEKLHPGGMNISMSSSSYYKLEDMVADKLEAVTNLIKERAFLVADEVPIVTTLIDEGAPEVAVAETIPAEYVADEQLPIVGMESIFKKVWKCLKKGGEEEEDKEEGGGGGDDDDCGYGYDYDYDNDISLWGYNYVEEEEEGEEEDDEYEDVGIIGVYGMGGVGKTTLLKQINKKLHLEKKNDFDIVIWVVVPRDLQLDKIQQQIGEQIGLFDNKNFEEKASDIFKILEERKFVLLMDDLWGRVDLTKVGVPFPNPENSSKIVFTTRSLQICSLMGADKQFKVTGLSNHDAWRLFKALVGDETLQSHPEVLKLAIGVSRWCYGLPLALVSIGRAMVSKKKPQEWSDALEVLRRSMTSYSGSDDQLKNDIRYNLKLSYDNLQNDMFKSCFLYCCLFPSHGKIKKSNLIDYWIGEGFLDERLGEQSQGHYIIDDLLSVCLLEQSVEDDNYVKMHYWIHDMSFWIARKIEMEKGYCFFFTDTYNFTDAQLTRYLVKATRMSLLDYEDTEMLPDMCPHLQTLFLIDSISEVISNDIFFQFMPSLKVLNLSNNFSLVNLPSAVSNLISLQHLDLSWTGIEELPKELRALKKLKCLNLEYTRSLRTIPRQMISEFSVLHVLRLWGCDFMLQSTSDSVVCNDAQLLIEEFLCLKNLSMLSISLKNSHALQRLLSSNRLQSCIQSLCLRDLSHPKSIKVPLTDLKHLNTLEISKCEYLEELEVDFVGEAQAQDHVRESPCSFYFLGKVIIRECRKLRELTWLILAPNLKSLEISNCDGMEEIINVGKLSECPELMGNVIPFSKLKRLILEYLPKLRSIYWIDLPFPDLKELTIADCPMPPLPPHLLNMVNVTSVVSCTRSPIWKPRDRVKLVKKEEITRSPIWKPRDRVKLVKKEGSTHNQLDRSPIKGELWGGRGGRDWYCHPKSGIVEITVRYSDVVDSLIFKHADENSGVITSKRIGGYGGEIEATIPIQWPNEYLISIKGKIVAFNKHEVVGNLYLFTNRHKVYGPYGCLANGKPFEFFEKNRAITGFFGREGNFIDAIGVYHQYPPPRIEISEGSTHNQLDRSPIKGELWGGEGGHDWDCHPKNGILGIKIRHSYVVDSLVFEYADENSGVITSEKVGGHGGAHVTTIPIQWPNEYLISIKGKIVTFNKHEVVGNLYLFTNRHKVYGPYGCLANGKPFEFFEKNRAIAGFFGREGNFIEAIGVYHQYPPPRIEISEVEGEITMNMDIPQEKLGPWGGNKGKAWDDGCLQGRIKQIDVHEGNGVIHAIDCQYESNNNDCNSSSSALSSNKHGGEGANIIHRIILGKDKCSPENLIGISGFHRSVDGNRCGDEVVHSISFYTDQGKYGPFGTETGTSFNSPVCTNAKVVGFHGRSGEYLDAIGVHIKY